MSLVRETKRYLRKLSAENHPLPTSADKIVVGVSGGADSLALLYTLVKLYEPNQLVVAHLHHGLREAADNDLAFVHATANALNLPFFSQKVAIKSLAKQEKTSIETAGRNARYAYFAEVAEAVGANYIAVGHHADDQAETMLHNLMRGTGVKGLGGMLPLRLDDASGKYIFRPLLMARKSELEAFCADLGIDPVVDETNTLTVYTRNKIRHDLLPLLAEFNPNVVEGLGNLSAVIQDEDAYLQAIAHDELEQLLELGDGFVRVSLVEWRNRPIAIQRRMLRIILSQLLPQDTEISFATLEAAREIAQRGGVGAEATLPADGFVRVGYEQIMVGVKSADILLDVPQLLMADVMHLDLLLWQPLNLGNRFRIVVKKVKGSVISQDPYTITIPYIKPLFLRSRVAGEKMQPLGMNGKSKSIQDIMVDKKIPAEARDNWPILATETNPIWIVGHTLDHRHRVLNKTQKLLQITCQIF